MIYVSTGWDYKVLILEISTCNFIFLYLVIQAPPSSTTQYQTQTKMKTFSIQSSKKNQFLKSGKRTASIESSITLGNVKSRASFHCFCGSHILRQLLRKFRKQWRQALGWQKNSVKYSYDIYSYSLNFDDGLYHVHLPPKGSQ